MDYEKKYKYAMEAMREWIAPCHTHEQLNNLKRTIFPELKESEDEKVRKALIRFHKSTMDIDGIKGYEIVAWLEKQETSYTKKDVDDAFVEGMALAKNELEKQSEQKSTDKVEQKFKVGDWVVNKGHSYLIADIDYLDNRYLFEIGGYTHEQLNWEYIENADNKYHLWTIKDAKEGDVLMSRSPFIYGKQCPYGGLDWYNNNFIKASNFIFTDSPVHPATKEQRDTLFAKMEEAGYEWDDEKIEVKKIFQRMVSAEAKEALYDKPTEWSEEDEVMIANIRDDLFCYQTKVRDEDHQLAEDIEKEINWLKSLKQRYTWKPSDEQITVLELASKYERVFTHKQIDILIGLKEQLKKLKKEEI